MLVREWIQLDEPVFSLTLIINSVKHLTKRTKELQLQKEHPTS